VKSVVKKGIREIREIRGQEGKYYANYAHSFPTKDLGLDLMRFKFYPLNIFISCYEKFEQ